ncbi:MAG TPA: hypothetical protein PK105_07990 [Rectinema sp.]|nr:hypothetical protein [Rectinema sp.]
MDSDYLLDENGAKIRAGTNGNIALDASENGSIDLRATGLGDRNIRIQGHIASWDQANDFITFESKIKANDGLEVGSIKPLISNHNIDIESAVINLRATGPGNRNIRIQGHITSWDQANDFIAFESKIKANEGLEVRSIRPLESTKDIDIDSGRDGYINVLGKIMGGIEGAEPIKFGTKIIAENGLDAYDGLNIEGKDAYCKISLVKFRENAESTQIQEGLKIELKTPRIIGMKKSIIEGRCNLIITGEKILIESKSTRGRSKQTTYIDLVSALAKIQSDIARLNERVGIE